MDDVKVIESRPPFYHLFRFPLLKDSMITTLCSQGVKR